MKKSASLSINKNYIIRLCHNNPVDKPPLNSVASFKMCLFLYSQVCRLSQSALAGLVGQAPGCGPAPHVSFWGLELRDRGRLWFETSTLSLLLTFHWPKEVVWPILTLTGQGGRFLSWWWRREWLFAEQWSSSPHVEKWASIQWKQSNILKF